MKARPTDTGLTVSEAGAQDLGASVVRSGEASRSGLQRAPSHCVLLVSHLGRTLIPSCGPSLMTTPNSHHLPKALLQIPSHCGVRAPTYGFGGHCFLLHSVCNLMSSGACFAPGVPCLFPSFFPAVSCLHSSPSVSEGCSGGMVHSPSLGFFPRAAFWNLNPAPPCAACRPLPPGPVATPAPARLCPWWAGAMTVCCSRGGLCPCLGLCPLPTAQLRGHPFKLFSEPLLGR